MNRTISILLTYRTACEASYKLEVLLSNEDADFNGVAREDVETARAELGRKGGKFVYDAPLWELIATELRDAGSVANNDGWINTANRIGEKLAGVERICNPKKFRPKMAAGNVATKFFRNTSRFPDALVREFISFALEGGRLPIGCKVVIEQSANGWGSGRGWAAFKSRSNYGRPATAKGGKVYVCAPGEDVECAAYRSKPKGGYLPRSYYGALERLFAVIAHEIRHVHQGFKPIFRECRKVRKFNLGTNGKLDEVDACLFEIRATRRFRREFPVQSPAVLPLP